MQYLTFYLMAGFAMAILLRAKISIVAKESEAEDIENKEEYKWSFSVYHVVGFLFVMAIWPLFAVLVSLNWVAKQALKK